jgi:hypothetical protein
LKSENFKVIFPAEIETEAQRIANTLEWVYNKNTKSLNIKPKPVPLVLYNRSMTSNAFAGLAPRRMGWYLNPPQSVTELGSLDWVDMLAIHEYRHIVQYAKNKQNFTKFMTYLYGDAGQSMMRWTIPDWFFEGDAVVMETALSNGGRGRMPEFDLEIRTFALNDIKYNYNQAYLGSYKRYYPSHYHLGYPLSAYARVQFGTDIWDKVLQLTSKIPFLPYAFGGSLKKYTGLNVSKLYKNTMLDLKSKWENESKELEITEVKKVNTKQKKSWISYSNPKFDNEGNIICIKQSLKQIPALYIISPDGKEKKLKNTDAETFTLSNNIICFDRLIPDVRWNLQNYSDIVEIGINSKIEKRVTFRKKYMSPNLSPDGKLIAAIEHGVDQKNRLCILDATTGEEVQAFEIGDNDYIRTPSWSKDGKKIVFTHANKNGQALSAIDINSKKITNIIDYSFENFGKPIFYNNYILYNSSWTGIGNIFAIDTISKQKYQVTSRPYGAYNADVSPDSAHLVFQDFSKDGFDIATMKLDPSKWAKIESVKPSEQHYVKKLVEQEGGTAIQDTLIQQIKFPVTKYNKFNDGIKIHSWGLYTYVPNIEFSLYSDNYLNTLSAQAGYLYNINEKTSTGLFGVNFSKYFPIFTFVTTYGQRRDTYQEQSTIYEDSWEEFVANFNVSLPFNFSRNVWNTKLTVKGGYNYLYIKNEGDSVFLSVPRQGNLHFYNIGFSFSNSIKQSWRDFNPKWAQSLAFDYKQVLSGSEYYGYLLSARTNLYLPGIFKQNSIRLGAAFEKQYEHESSSEYNSYYFSSLHAFPRGFKPYTFDRISKLSADYQFPVCYPDLSIGSLLYIKRIRAGAFYDYANASWKNLNLNYQSFGGSLVMEFFVFRYKYPLEIGFQYSYKLSNPLNENIHDVSLLFFGLPF